MDLTGKWRYIENYGYGVAEGELYLKQKGQMLAGRIVFTDKVEGESSYMIQEFLKGELEGRKVRLEAVEFDIIHSEFPITYQLDHWFGLLVDDNTIKGVSKDGQGVEGILRTVGRIQLFLESGGIYPFAERPYAQTL